MNKQSEQYVYSRVNNATGSFRRDLISGRLEVFGFDDKLDSEIGETSDESKSPQVLGGVGFAFSSGREVDSED
jgi:hypothetical protein